MTTDAENSLKTDPASAADVYVDPPSPPPVRRGGSRAALAIGSAALVLVLTAPYWTPPVYRLLRLRPAGLEWQARQEVETGRLGQSLAELDRRLAELNGLVAKANDQSAGVKTAQAAMETQVRVLTLLQFRAVLRRPVPFDAELKAVRAMGGKNGDLDALLGAIEPYASTGIPLEGQLYRDFAQVADAVTRTEPRPSVLHWLGGITGWSAEPAPASDTEARTDRSSLAVERAQARLNDDDLRGAIEALATLEGDAAAAARRWLDEAQARLIANQVYDRIAESIAGALGRVSARS